MKSEARDPPKYAAPQDTLPAYSPAVNYSGIVLVLHEQISPYQSISSQKWQPMIMELNSTQINLYRVQSTSLEHHILSSFDKCVITSLDQRLDIKNKRHIVSRAPMDGNKDDFLFRMIQGDLTSAKNMPFFEEFQSSDFIDCLEGLRGPLCKSYTLQRSQIGSAADRTKESFALRLRLEIEQFCIRVASFKQFANWYYKIKTAADIALPLESTYDTESSISSEMSDYERTYHVNVTNGKNEKEDASVVSCRIKNVDFQKDPLFGRLTTAEAQSYLSLVAISQDIEKLTMRQKWVGNPVVVFTNEAKPILNAGAQQYLYNPKTSQVFPESHTIRDEAMTVGLIGKHLVSKYVKAANHIKRGCTTTAGQEFLIAANGLVVPR